LYYPFLMNKDNTINEIYISFIYINKLNEIEDVSRENYKLNTINFISKEELTNILKNYIYSNSKKIKSYTITSILQYNVTIFSEEEINSFLSTDSSHLSTDSSHLSTDSSHLSTDFHFLKIIKQINDIHWEPSLSIFKELNELFIIFYENIEIKNCNNKTKKVYLQNMKKNTRKNNPFF